MTISDREVRALQSAERLLARYAQSVDARDGDAVANLFTLDGQVERPEGNLRGREEIRRHFGERARTRPRVRHHVATIDAWLDEFGLLHAKSYFQVIGARFVAGVYEDDFELVDDDWLIKRKTINIEMRD